MNGDHVMSKYMHKVRDMYIFTRCADVIKNSCNMSNLLQGSVAVTADTKRSVQRSWVRKELLHFFPSVHTLKTSELHYPPAFHLLDRIFLQLVNNWLGQIAS